MKEFEYDGRKCSDFQGKLFEQSVTRYNCSSKIFLRRFLKSDVLTYLDKNTVDSIYWSVPEALDVIEKQYGESNYGSVKYPSEAMYWMGYFYRYISYTRSIDTSILFFHFPPEEVIKKYEVYEVYHTQSMEWGVSSFLSSYKLTPLFFDPNWRMKQILIKHGYPDK